MPRCRAYRAMGMRCILWGEAMTPTQKQFYEVMNDSALQYIMRDLDVMSGRPHTDAEKAEVLTRLAKDAPELMEQEIRRLQGKIDLIRTYLPAEATDDRRE